MVYYEQRKPRLVLRNAPPRRTDPPRVVLREQRLETPFPNGNNPTNLPFHMAYLQQPYHGSFQNMVPGTLPYPNFQTQLSVAYNVPLNMNMVPGHLALQTSNTRNHHRDVTVHNGRHHERNEETYAVCTPVLGERRDENTGRVSPRVALRTMMQQALRPSINPEKFGRQTHHHQHSHQPRGRFDSSLREFSTGSDVAICPPIDRSLEARIREQLARSGLLRDCPEPEYVNRPMVADPSIVSCGRAVKQHDPIHHRRPQYIFGHTQPPEDFRFVTNRELSGAHFVNNSPLKAQRNTGIPTYKTTTPQSKVQRIQAYRGVDSVVKEPKRRDSLQSYKAEGEPKFLTKDDYSPTKQIIGYWVNSPSGSPRSSKIIPVKSLVNQEETTPKPLRQPVKNRIGGVSEPELREDPTRDDKVKINTSEDTPQAVFPPINTVDHESPIQIIEIVDKYATNPKDHAHVTVRDVSDEEPSESPDHKKTADLLEDCIRSLATWNKGDRKVLHKLLKALKSFDDDDDAKPIKNLGIAHDAKRSPRKEREYSSSLNPNAECFKDFASACAHIPHTHNGYHGRRGLSLQEEVIPTSNERPPVMFYSKPLMPAESIWIKTQPDGLVRPPPSLAVPFRPHVGRKVPVKTSLKQMPSDEEEGRVAKVMDHRLAEPLLARFHEKYPLTGTVCTNPPSPPPAPVKSAAEIQEELERLLLQEKEKKAFAKPSELAGKLRAPKGPCRVEASKLVK